MFYYLTRNLVFQPLNFDSGPVLLTMSLLDFMIKSQPSRIINVSSVAHAAGQINFRDLNSEKGYHMTLAYNQSKLATLMFTKELAKHLQGRDCKTFTI